MEAQRISDSEWKVMEEVWKDPPTTSPEIQRALGERENWKVQTVKTLLGRLVKKGALSFRKDGNRYLYSPEISRDEAVRVETESFLDRVTAGSLTPLVAHLVQTKASLDPDEMNALRELLDRADENTEDEKS